MGNGNMDVFWKKGQIEDALTRSFVQRYKNKGVALTGILLARPEDSLTRDEILPHLDYWNYRSGDDIDFFCVGYLPRRFADSADDLPPVVTVGNGQWAFARSAFVEILAEVEATAGVAYDGSPCLLLLNSYFDDQRERAYLDYSRIVWINFREALADEAVSTPTQLAEHVFQFAQQANERPKGSKDPVWEMSDSLGRRVLKGGIKDALLAFLPDWAKPSARRAIHFAVREF
jgi:hypothetical protein